MHRRRIASALLGVLGIFALASVAHATTLLKLTMSRTESAGEDAKRKKKRKKKDRRK